MWQLSVYYQLWSGKWKWLLQSCAIPNFSCSLSSILSFAAPSPPTCLRLHLPPSSFNSTYLLPLPSITSFVPLFLPSTRASPSPPTPTLFQRPPLSPTSSFCVLPPTLLSFFSFLLNPYLHLLLPYLPSLLPLLPPSLYLLLINRSFTFFYQNDKDGDGWGDACDFDRD